MQLYIGRYQQCSNTVVLIPYFNLFRISYSIFELQQLLQAFERNPHVDLKIMYSMTLVVLLNYILRYFYIINVPAVCIQCVCN